MYIYTLVCFSTSRDLPRVFVTMRDSKKSLSPDSPESCHTVHHVTVQCFGVWISKWHHRIIVNL